MQVKCTLDADKGELRVEVAGGVLQDSNIKRHHRAAEGYTPRGDDSELLKSFLVGAFAQALRPVVHGVTTSQTSMLVRVHDTYAAATLGTLLLVLNTACWMNHAVCETELTIRYA